MGRDDDGGAGKRRNPLADSVVGRERTAFLSHGASEPRSTSRAIARGPLGQPCLGQRGLEAVVFRVSQRGSAEEFGLRDLGLELSTDGGGDVVSGGGIANEVVIADVETKDGAAAE